MDEQIAGLPEGATVRPMQQPKPAASDPSQVEGLPEGATLRPVTPPAPKIAPAAPKAAATPSAPMSAAPVAKSVTPAGPTATEQHDQKIVNGVKDYAGGLANSVGLPESTEEYKQQAQESSALTPGNVLRTLGGPAGSMLESGYNLGKKYLKNIVGAGKEAYEAGQNIGAGQPILPNLAKPASALVEANVGAVPFVGAPTVQAGHDIAQGKYAHAAGELTGTVGQVSLPELQEHFAKDPIIKFHDEKVAEAQMALDKAKKPAEPYIHSAAQGIEPPAEMQKPIVKAQEKLDEAIGHRDLAKEAIAKQVQEARTHKTTPEPKAAPEVPAENIEAQPAKPQPALGKIGAPQTVSPAHATTSIQRPLVDVPKPSYGRIALANDQGTMGTPKQLTEGTPEATAAPAVKPAEAPKPVTDEASLRSLEAKKGQVVENTPKKVGELLKQALTPGEMRKDAPTTVEKAPVAAEKPAEAPLAKAKNPAIPENWSPENDKIGVREKMEYDNAIEKRAAAEAPKKEELVPVGEEGREPAKSAAEYHPAVEQKISELSDDKLKALAKAHGLNPDEYDFKARDEGRHRTDRDQLAKDITAQLGDDEKANLGRAAESTEKQGLFQGADTSAKGRAARAEKMFPRLRGPVDEFGNPKAAGGAPEEEGALSINDKSAKETIENDKNMPKHPAEEAAKQTVGTKEAADKDNEHFANAKKELPNGSISYVAKRAQELKDTHAQLAEHDKNGGSTFSSKGKDLNGTNKYSVGSYPDRTEQVDKLTPERLDEFKKKNADVLSKDDHAVGTWKDPDTGKAVLDVARTYADRDEAIAAGKAANQKSIYHLGGEGEIQTGGTGEGPAQGTPEKPQGEDLSYSNKNDEHRVTTLGPDGKKVGELVAKDNAPGTVEVTSNQIHDKGQQGQGRGSKQITHLLDNVKDETHTVKSDISTTDQARGAWEKIMKSDPEAVTKKVYADGQTQYTVDMAKWRGENLPTVTRSAFKDEGTRFEPSELEDEKPSLGKLGKKKSPYGNVR